MFDYQSDWHCSKTDVANVSALPKFDYQSDWHCSKTADYQGRRGSGLITSQIGTAPKLMGQPFRLEVGLITSQIGTAPKPQYASMSDTGV